MKIFWKVIVAVIAFSLLGIMIVLGTAYIKSVERHTYLADNKVLSDNLTSSTCHPKIIFK